MASAPVVLSGGRARRSTRAAAAAISIALIGATLSPLARAPRDDGFPLSTYPMFAFARPTRLTISYALGETAGGARVTLAPWLVGSAEVLQAMRIVEGAVRRGSREQTALCERIAARVAGRGELAAVTAIRIVTGTHDALDVLLRDRYGSERERVRCRVRRPP